MYIGMLVVLPVGMNTIFGRKVINLFRIIQNILIRENQI